MAWGPAQGQPFPQPRAVQLSDRVHVLLGPVQHADRDNQGYMVNATVIVGERGVILVDTGGSADVGRHLAAAVRKITDKPVTHVVNTHHHGDHYLGNAAFDGATIIGSTAGRQLVLETGGEWLATMEDAVGHALPSSKPIAAGVTYAAGTKSETRIEGVRMVFWASRGSHTAGDLMVYLPDDRTFVAGDVLVHGVVPTLQDAFVKSWIGTLDEIRALGDIRFVPGHGNLMTARDVASMREQMDRFYTGVKQGYRKGLDEQQVRRSLDLTAWEKLERAYVIPRNINRAYLEAEREVFDEMPGR